ncbi:MAG: hypothetical protein U0931_25970 [Vulcanimicrobiota bacterium]
MSLSKQEAQRLLERVGKLENQVASMKFKLEAFERILRPEELMRRVKEGIAEEKRKAEAAKVDLAAAAELLGPKPGT